MWKKPPFPRGTHNSLVVTVLEDASGKGPARWVVGTAAWDRFDATRPPEDMWKYVEPKEIIPQTLQQRSEFDQQYKPVAWAWAAEVALDGMATGRGTYHGSVWQKERLPEQSTRTGRLLMILKIGGPGSVAWPAFATYFPKLSKKIADHDVSGLSGANDSGWAIDLSRVPTSHFGFDKRVEAAPGLHDNMPKIRIVCWADPDSVGLFAATQVGCDPYGIEPAKPASLSLGVHGPAGEVSE